MLNAILIFATFIGLIFLGMPISMSMAIGTVVASLLGHFTISAIPLLLGSGVANFSLVAIPYFVLLGNLMNIGGITDRMFDFADACIGHIKGGLAQVNVLASVIFAGVSGTSSADAAGLGMVEINAMKKKGYDVPYSVAITMVSSILGPIIPPSVCMLIYCSISGVSVARQFSAGIVPGVLFAIVLCVINYRIALKGKVQMPDPRKFDWGYLWKTVKNGFLALLCPIILLVTMLSGAITPTEAGVVGTVYSLFVGFVYKELNWDKFKRASMETVKSCGLIMFLIGIGSALGWYLTALQIPQTVTSFLLGLTDSKILILLFINIIMLILGMVIDSTAIQLIMVPVVLPIIDALAISRIHFGIMVTFNILVGTMTPPYGMGLFIMASVTELKIPQILKATKPFYIPVLIMLLLLTYAPFLSTWLPSILYP